MAIFGSLTDMPLTDLLPMLGRRNGVLEVWKEQQNVSIWLEAGLLRSVWLDGNNLEAPAARSLLLELMQVQGSFEFNLGQPTLRCDYLLDWPLEEIMGIPEAASAQLPDSETQFQAIHLEIWLEEPLFGFWQQAKPLLSAGASAQKIAQQLEMPLETVRRYLHQLRLVGRIGPVRAYRLQPVSPEHKNLIARLLEAIIRRDFK